MIARVLSGLLSAVLIFMLSACGGASGLPDLPPAPKGTYSLDSGDRVQVTVFGEPRLTANYTVTDSGHVSMPLLGQVEARGLTMSQLQNAIAQQLRAGGFVINPSVSVQMDQFRPFFILGQVERPGQYPYTEGMTVLTAAAIGGGFTFRANKDTVTVTRTVGGDKKEFRATRDSTILPGDTIFVFERYF